MEKLLKVEQVAELLQVYKRTIYDWAHVDYIPHYKLPHGVRFSGEEIVRWFRKRQLAERGRCCVGVDL